MTASEIEDRLALASPLGQGSDEVRRAAALAAEIYAGLFRDQGTPYIKHPIAVALILRDEAKVRAPRLLALALLHDALEVRPASESRIEDALGGRAVAALRSMTPDHRLAGRHRTSKDDAAYARKIRALPDALLAIRLADRLHNLRDLPTSACADRGVRFLSQLTRVYLPLARTRRSPAVCRLARLLEEDRAHLHAF